MLPTKNLHGHSTEHCALISSSAGTLAVGMNSVYVSMMSGLVGMLQNLELKCGILSGLFNASGAIMMFALAPDMLHVKVGSLFSFYAFYSIIIFVLVLILYPPYPYDANSAIKLFQPLATRFRNKVHSSLYRQGLYSLVFHRYVTHSDSLSECSRCECPNATVLRYDTCSEVIISPHLLSDSASLSSHEMIISASDSASLIMHEMIFSK